MTGYEERRAEMLAALGYTAFAMTSTAPTPIRKASTITARCPANSTRIAVFRERLLGAIEAARGLEGAWTGEMVTDGLLLRSAPRAGGGPCRGGSCRLSSASRRPAHARGSGLVRGDGRARSSSTGRPIRSRDSHDLAVVLGELQEAGIPHDAQIFGGARHSFTVYGSADYDLDADSGSWAGLQAFLAATF